MVPAGEGFGLPKEPAGEPMKPFDLPKRGALTANETMPGHVAGGAANDLRSYLQRSVVLRSRALAEASRRSEPMAPVLVNGRAKPTLNSIDDVLAHLRAPAEADAPRAILVMAARPEIDATHEAIRIARAQSAEQKLCVLIDLTRGPAGVCAKLGIPRAPGFAELAAGHASFDDVVHVDDETPLQVIPAGQAAARRETKHEPERLARIFAALAQAYHFMVLHADRETAFNYQPVLAGRLRTVLAVVASGEGKSRRADQALAELAGFGCTVMLHEQSAERRWFLRRSA
jgi:Mrp family chromosome partitioning ATPase